MQIHDSLEHLPVFRNAVLTIGSFDGVHSGHLGIIRKMKDLADQIGGVSVVVTFYPHPRQVIYPQDDSLQLLSSKKEKVILFRRTGIDHLVFCPFTIEFSQWHAREYVEKFIIEKFYPAYVVIGYDHRFGLNRMGNIQTLRSYEKDGHFKILELAQKVTQDIEVSSTRIRNFILEGKMTLANELLGHPYLLSGKVIRGQQLGEKLGYPTANLELEEDLKLVPPFGIYVVKVEYQQRKYGGMLYIGTRPTVSAAGKRSIEVHIFDFNDDLYGKQLDVEILEFIREDQTFDNLETLRRQLDRDLATAKQYLSSNPEALSDTSVVILNYNGREHLEKFLPNVVRFSDGFPIIVADNASRDDSIMFLKTNYPQIKIIELSQNFGFAAGYNEALRSIQSEMVIFLNSDVEVTNQWAEKLVDFMKKNPNAGAAQPKVRSLLNRNYFEYAGAAGGLLDRFGYPFCQGRILSEVEEDLGQYNEFREIFWTSGAAMIIRRDIFERIGGFDGDFFAHMEEIDLCWRLKRAGFKNWILPHVTVYHLGGGTLPYHSPKKTYLNFRNSYSLLIKNERMRTLSWMLPLRVGMDFVAFCRFMIIGENANARALLHALVSVSKMLGNNWRKRLKARQLIERLRIGPANLRTGRYQGSIIWEFFVLGRRKYHDLRRVANKLL